MSRAAFLLLLALLSGCAIWPQPRAGMANYDFGLSSPRQNAHPRLQQDLVVADVSAPAWMDNSNMYYRLVYQDATRPRAYALSHWVMSPAALLGQRLRADIARASKAGVFAPADGVRAEYTLRLNLEEFSQVFDTATSSHAELRLRAVLMRMGEVVAQRQFNTEHAAATPNAEGGVRALIAASDATGAKLVGWLAANMKR